jgi:hypothetical protein
MKKDFLTTFAAIFCFFFYFFVQYRNLQYEKGTLSFLKFRNVEAYSKLHGSTKGTYKNHEQQEDNGTANLKIDASSQMILVPRKDQVPVAQYFITPEEEVQHPFRDSSKPGFAQPIPISASGRLVVDANTKAMNASRVMCFHYRSMDGGECGRGTLSYSFIQNEKKFTCRKLFDGLGLPVPESAGCSPGFDSFTPLLFLDGPTYLFSRTAHFPHFLEEVVTGANWLAKHNLSYFSHAVIDENGGNCHTHGEYRSGSWAASGSPLNQSLQIAMMKTIAKVIVFSWGVRQKKSVCVGNPWRASSEEIWPPPWFDNPSVCSKYRSRMMKLLDIEEASPSGKLRVLILQRFSGGRVVVNLEDMGKLGLELELNVTLRYTSLHGLSLKEQVQEFSQADIVIGHHGAGLALAACMKPRSLVIEIFNYMATCNFFTNLGKRCELKWEQVFNSKGNHYPGLPHQCNGNNMKDGSDDAPVNLHEVSKILRRHVVNRTLPLFV